MIGAHTHCMMGRGRPHHHVTKKGSEDVSKRPTIVMDRHFLKPNSTANSQTISNESVTCIAVKEDRHQNIMNSLVLKQGIEEPSASERVARFSDSLWYTEVMLKSDLELAIILFRNRAAENCNAEVTVEDAIKRGETFNWISRKRSDVFERCHLNH